MFYCQVCSDTVIYMIHEKTLVQARMSAIEKMEQDKLINYVNILASDFTFLERLSAMPSSY